MSVLTLIQSIFKPAADLIDALHTSEEEKLQAKNGLMLIQGTAVAQAITLETAAINAKRDIIVAETRSDSWLTRSWRPIVMLMLTFSILAFWFGLTPESPMLTEKVILSMYGLVKIGVGGYIASRGAEKIAPGIIAAFKKKEET